MLQQNIYKKVQRGNDDNPKFTYYYKIKKFDKVTTLVI